MNNIRHICFLMGWLVVGIVDRETDTPAHKGGMMMTTVAIMSTRAKKVYYQHNGESALAYLSL